LEAVGLVEGLDLLEKLQLPWLIRVPFQWFPT
jgi:hypothetical protein